MRSNLERTLLTHLLYIEIKVKPEKRLNRFFPPLLFQVLPAFITLNSKRFNDCVWLRRSAAVLTVLLIGFANASDMVNVFCLC